MQGIARRIIYVTLYEGIAVCITSFAIAGTGNDLAHASVAGIGTSILALLWNLVWNALFERWERRQTVKGRSTARRLAHTLGFEGGLTVFIVPFFAWWLGISLWRSLMLDAGMIAFFLCYTFFFNLSFDHLFGLPTSAQPNNQKA